MMIFTDCEICGERLITSDPRVTRHARCGQASVKPNCYKCKHRGTLPGSAHSCCKHPQAAGATDDPFTKFMAMMAGVGRTMLPVIGSGVAELEISCSAHGLRSGWFNWPYDFDPIWLENCKGFEEKQTEGVANGKVH